MNLSPLPLQKFFDNAGNPLNGGLLFTYTAGTTTKIATYQDQAGTPNTNPVVLNFRGEANIWLDQTLTYKFVLAPVNDTDPPTAPIWSVDNISAAVTYASLTQQIIGQILYPRTPAEIAAGVTPVNYWHPPGIADRFGTNTTPGTTDMTTALVNWAKCATTGLSMGLIPGGLYLFDPSIVMNGVLFSGVAGFSVYGNGATIIAKAGAPVVAQHEMMRFNNCQDVYVENLIIDGNRATRTPTPATAHNINIAQNCARILFNDVRSINSVVDGWYVGSDSEGTPSTYPTDITLSNCIGDNSYRNGLSVIVSNRCKVKGGRYINTTGSAPQAGIDAEPDAVGGSTGNTDLTFEDIDVSNNVGYGLSVAGPNATQTNTRVVVRNLRGQGNTAGLMTVSSANGLDVDGVYCGPHSAATRGVIDIANGTVTDVAFRNLNFHGVTINSAARWLFYNFGITGRLLIDGFRAYNCPNLPAINTNSATDIDGVDIESTPDASISLFAATSTLKNLTAKTATGRVVYVSIADCVFENLTFIDCLVASGHVMTVDTGATGTTLKNIEIIQTSSIPASATGILFNEVPRYIANVSAKSATTDFTSANIFTFSAGTAGSCIYGCRPDPFRIATTWNPPNIVNGSSANQTFTITGANFLDPALAAMDSDLAGMGLSAYVSAPNTVRVVLENNTGGALDIANSNIVVWVEKRGA